MSADEPALMSRRTVMASLAALTAAGCSRAGFIAINLPASFGAYKRHVDLRYGPDAAHTVDVYVPDATPVGPRPLVVFWYGGRWSEGDKAYYKFVGAALAGLGYVAVLPNYRHYPKVKMAGFMGDAAVAAQWAAEHGAAYGADPKALYLMGHSAGAHMAALVTLDTRYFAATGKPMPAIAGVIGLSGPYDFLPLTDADTEDMFGPPDNYPNSQPIHFVQTSVPGVAPVGASTPPMLLIHGDADVTVKLKNSVNLARALEARGASVTLKVYPKMKHADTVAAMGVPLRGRAPTLKDVAAFVAATTRQG